MIKTYKHLIVNQTHLTIRDNDINEFNVNNEVIATQTNTVLSQVGQLYIITTIYFKSKSK